MGHDDDRTGHARKLGQERCAKLIERTQGVSLRVRRPTPDPTMSVAPPGAVPATGIREIEGLGAREPELRWVEVEERALTRSRIGTGNKKERSHCSGRLARRATSWNDKHNCDECNEHAKRDADGHQR